MRVEVDDKPDGVHCGLNLWWQIHTKVSLLEQSENGAREEMTEARAV